jgi:hypothetical protein
MCRPGCHHAETKSPRKNKYVFLLDEALSLEPYKQISPLLAETLLEMAVNTSAYRKAADSLEAIQGHRVVSHETVRQRVLEAGERLQDAQDAELADPCGKASCARPVP